MHCERCNCILIKEIEEYNKLCFECYKYLYGVYDAETGEN